MIYPAQLSVLYPFRPGYHPLPFLAALSGLLGISTLAVLQIRNRPWLFVGWFWYLVILLPVIGLIQIGRQSIADRYTYLPSIGIGIGIVWTVREWIGGRAARKHLAGWAAVIAIGAFVFGTWIQTYRWRNTLTLFEHSIRVTGDNPTLEVNLAYRLSEIGDLDRAIGMTESVLERHPSLYQAAVNLGSFYLQQKNYEASLDRLERALSIHNEHRHEILGYIGTVYKRQGNLETAVQYYRQSLDINPHNPAAFNEMGEIRNLQGSVAEAIDFWQRSLEADPHYLPALHNLAWTLSTSTEDSLRRPEQGLRCAQQALRSSGTLSVKALDILAAAYAACGNFQDAVSCAEQAIRLLPQDHNQEIKIALEKRLQLYKSGQPYREEFSLDNKQE
jgi:tetratricopeptide (TPR) repeat protein